MKKNLLIGMLLMSCGFLQAQTSTDGLMMPTKTFCGGFLYGHDQWTNYWEGGLKRSNGNIGTVSTQSVTFMGTYGLNSKVNIIAAVPYVWTKASQGTLHGMQGVQDLTVTAKHRFFRSESEVGVLNFFDAVSFSTPLTNYTPDFFPLSIGTASKRLSYRATGNYAFKKGWYFNASAAYTWRSNVTLDRPAYFANNQLYLSDQVHMPNVFDFIVDIGYHKTALQGEVYYTQQNTLGGTDIRRQDMPFVSNRMNFSKVGGLIMYYLPWPKNFAVRAMASYVVKGVPFEAVSRNVGQSTTLTAGFLYTVYFTKNQ
jgi:hypothetical protein